MDIWYEPSRLQWYDAAINEYRDIDPEQPGRAPVRTLCRYERHALLRPVPGDAVERTQVFAPEALPASYVAGLAQPFLQPGSCPHLAARLTRTRGELQHPAIGHGHSTRMDEAEIHTAFGLERDSDVMLLRASGSHEKVFFWFVKDDAWETDPAHVRSLRRIDGAQGLGGGDENNKVRMGYVWQHAFQFRPDRQKCMIHRHVFLHRAATPIEPVLRAFSALSLSGLPRR